MTSIFPFNGLTDSEFILPYDKDSTHKSPLIPNVPVLNEDYINPTEITLKIKKKCSQSLQ